MRRAMASRYGALAVGVLGPEGAQDDHLGHGAHKGRVVHRPVHGWGQDNSMSLAGQKIDLFGSRTGSEVLAIRYM